MTEEENPRKARAGISLFLGKRKERAFHIPTAPAAATLSQPNYKERSFPPPLSRLPFRLILQLEKTQQAGQAVPLRLRYTLALAAEGSVCLDKKQPQGLEAQIQERM